MAIDGLRPNRHAGLFHMRPVYRGLTASGSVDLSSGHFLSLGMYDLDEHFS